MNTEFTASINFGTPWIWPVTLAFQSISSNEDIQAAQALNWTLWGPHAKLEVFLKEHFLSSLIPVVYLVDNSFAKWNAMTCRVLELKCFKLCENKPLSRVHRYLSAQHKYFAVVSSLNYYSPTLSLVLLNTTLYVPLLVFLHNQDIRLRVPTPLLHLNILTNFLPFKKPA
jgi:hypothetical protein